LPSLPTLPKEGEVGNKASTPNKTDAEGAKEHHRSHTGGAP
jgi:hypothetical protein